ncbi:MAG: amino acid ABC transporter ATP-binding protein [Oscillospiraceae bacterium]|nr:amino acid ABC transporter ATP-binding protein [Oscillospiraceae bacterium]
MAVLEVNNLSKRFGTSEVLKEVSFTLSQGEILAVIGSSGSGKTTLLRCLNFLESIESGSIKVHDRVLFDSNDQVKYDENDIRQRRLHFGLIFQSFNLFPQYTALENVTLAPILALKKNSDSSTYRSKLSEDIRAEGIALLERMGLETKQDSYPHQLSGGQQQRVAIARALALKPDILCFDEPTSALDPELTGEVLKVIRSLADGNTTMIIVTHEMQFAKEIADNIMFLDEGMVVEYGNADEILSNSKNERIMKFLDRYESTGDY